MRALRRGAGWAAGTKMEIYRPRRKARWPARPATIVITAPIGTYQSHAVGPFVHSGLAQQDCASSGQLLDYRSVSLGHIVGDDPRANRGPDPLVSSRSFAA